MFNILRKIDIFTIKPKFYIFKQISVSSKIGILLTLIQISISFLVVIYTCKTFFNRENFTTSFTQDTMQYYEFKQSENPLFISIFDYQAQPVPLVFLEKYLVFEVDYFAFFNISKPNMKVYQTSFKLEKCNFTTNLKNYDNLVRDNIIIDNFLCLPQSENDLKIIGTFGDFKGFSQIRIKISKCINGTQNNNSCFDIEKINKFIKNSLIIWGSIDYDINHNIPDDPFVSKVVTEAYYMTTENLKSIKVRRKKITYTTDYGFFFKNNHTLGKIFIDYSIPVIEDFNQNDLTGNYFMNLYIETSGKKDNHFRRYQKLQEALAGAFTILASLKSLSFLIIEIFYDKIYFQKLINNILLPEEEDITKQKPKKIKDLRISIYNRNTFIESPSFPQQEELHDNSKIM